MSAISESRIRFSFIALRVRIILLMREGTKRLEVLTLDSLVLESFSKVSVGRRFRVFRDIALKVEIFRKNRSYSKKTTL